jgi:uncharacterized protein with GYD domain
MAELDQLGGKIVSGYLASRDYEAVVIVVMPSHVAVAALVMAVAAGGACKDVKTTPLITIPAMGDVPQLPNWRSCLVEQARRRELCHD